MAYLLGHIRATATQTHPDGTTHPITYRCSFLQIYTRHNNHWAAILNAPSVKLESAQHRGRIDSVDFLLRGKFSHLSL